MQTLLLTSPHMHGDPVKRAQYIMNGNNVFKQDYYRGELDSDYGEMTAQAAYRAHFWAGFTLPECQKVGRFYGEVLDGILTGAIKLDKKRSALRGVRMRAAQEGPPMRVKAFNHFLTHLGETEHPPYSNRSYATAWYGMVGAWCAMSVTESYVSVGSKAFVKGQRWAYVPFMESAAREGRNFLTITLDPQQGDPVCFDWDDDGVSDHVGEFDHWINRAAGTFATLEGNTSAASNSNGGIVMRRERSLSDVSFRHGQKPAFIHVGA